ncbi:pentatricopeptide repeat-containing protein DOT4, chloroplastic-like [Abrus precatorius]|uniref:Pentatricopeptide repeat-containing protein DOT4, chloroplastic-like n=1 Tax=Abrus precatorius TaxID=3816 RepID=A0A8B8LRH2_ABRPR|nr:pentatricopeptide repeat-containing protein DOT4, chloroplastic-like [Abrus precatorius]
MSLRLSSLANFKRPLYLWNLMIRDSTNNGFFLETLKIYYSMTHCGVHGNSFTYPMVLKACANLASSQHGTMLHGQVMRLGFQGDTFVQTALVDTYSKSFEVASARQVFDEMPQRSAISWNAMVSAYTRVSLMDQALSLLKEMWVLGFEPSSSTFVSILSGYSKLDSSEFHLQGMSIHCCLIKLGLVYLEASLANSLMGMYAQFGQMDEARKVFDLMDEKSIISWTAIMGGYVKIGLAVEAFYLFKQMQHQRIGRDFVVFLNLISGCIEVGELLLASSVHSLVLKCGYDEEDSIENSLITMYAKCGNLTSAERIFDLISEKSILSWTSMIAGYAHSGHPVEALDLFRRMARTDIRPNGATLATVLSACADLGSLSMGQEIEEYVFLNGLESDQQVQTSLIHMYSKCGSIKKAREVFERVTDKDLTVWTSMINSYANHGMGNEAISLFHKMTTAEGIMPDAIVYTSILLACSHSGLVEHGLKFFNSMQKDFAIAPTVEHYMCLVDLLGRVGQLDLALDAIQGMPLAAQAQAWGPLLSACRIHGNVELGELVAAKLLDLSPGSSGSYVLMANLYTSLGKWKEAHMMRNLIEAKGLVKECGWSQVEVSGRFHAFAAGNQSRVGLVNIYKTLQDLNFTLQEGSYTAETISVND